MSQLRFQTLNSATRAATKLEALLTLSRALAGTSQDGITSEALDLLLAATAYTRGAAFAHQDGALELVAHRALPPYLRTWIERLPVTEPSWFIAQTAMQARALVSAHVVSTAQAVEIGPAAFAAAGWAYSVACPISAGREIHGVIMLASPAAMEPDDALKAAMEIACRLLALQIPRRPAEPRSDGAATSTMAALGVLTCGLAAELDEHLATIQHGVVRQNQLADRLKRQGAAGVGLELEALSKGTAAALRQAADVATRLLSTFQSAFPASPGPSSRRAGAAAGPPSNRAGPPSGRADARPANATAPATPLALAQLRRSMSRFDTLRSEGGRFVQDAAPRPDPRTARTEPAFPIDGLSGDPPSIERNGRGR